MTANDRRPDSVGGEPRTSRARPVAASRRDPTTTKRPASRSAQRNGDVVEQNPDDTGRVGIVTADLPTPAPTSTPTSMSTRPAADPDLARGVDAPLVDRNNVVTAKQRPQKPQSHGSNRRSNGSNDGSGRDSASRGRGDSNNNSTNNSNEPTVMIDPGLVVTGTSVEHQSSSTRLVDQLPAPATQADLTGSPQFGDPRFGDPRLSDHGDVVDAPARRQPSLVRFLQRLKEPLDTYRVGHAQRAVDAEVDAEVVAEVDGKVDTASFDEVAQRSARPRSTLATRPAARSTPTELPGHPPAPSGPALFSPHSPLGPAVSAPTRVRGLVPARPPAGLSPMPRYVDVDPEPEHAQIPTAPSVKRVVRSTAAVVRRRPRVRRVTRVIRHVDPWSVFKVALCFSVVLYGVCLTAGVLLWNVAYTTGTIDNMERFFESFGWDTFEFKGGELYHNAWIGGLFAAVGLTGLIVLAVTLFNLITDLVGGVRVTVLEEEVVERDPLLRRAVLGGRQAGPRTDDPYDPDAPIDHFGDDLNDDFGDHLDREPTAPMPSSVGGAVPMRIESTRDLHNPR